MDLQTEITVVGGGLAGAEAAYYLAKRGYNVTLKDIKPKKFTPAHHSEKYGELVCSNSLKSDDVYGNACGLLKQEMRVLGSMIIACADDTKVPAGNALAVDRELFAQEITDKINSCENIKRVCEEVEEIDFSRPTIIATGPLTTDKLSQFIKNVTGGFYFFDAAAPIVSAESIDYAHAFKADRYGEGEGDYLNCPIDKEGYDAFYEALITAERAKLKDFENAKVFEGCMPVEIMAARGKDTLRFGPLKPVGLYDPATGKRPYACMQLRKENAEGTMYNLVGFQTNLTFPEQKRVFANFPALKNAEFLRYGVMHKNTFINSPSCLDKYFSLKEKPLCFFAGQITGVEGYVESAASGLAAAINLDLRLKGKTLPNWNNKTVLGALANYVCTPNADFQPMNANYGILSAVEYVGRNKAEKRKIIAERALKETENIKKSIE